MVVNSDGQDKVEVLPKWNFGTLDSLALWMKANQVFKQR